MQNQVSFIERNDDGINSFIAACNDMMSAKFLLAEKKISALLSTIAEHERLYDLFRQALKGYNRQIEWKKSVVTVGGRNKLVLPQTQSRFIAYAFCLLMEVDTGKRSLRSLLDEFFYHTNPNEEFTLFCKTVIAPFRDVTEYAFINGLDSIEEEDGVDFSLRETVKDILQKLNSAVNESVTVDASIKQDLFAIARAIESSLTPNRVDLIKPLLIGYRNTVNGCALRETLSPLVDELKKVLVSADIF
jgi:hypothetical protein